MSTSSWRDLSSSRRAACLRASDSRCAITSSSNLFIRSWVRTRARNSSTSIGLVMTSSAPHSKPSTLRSVRDSPVTSTVGSDRVVGSLRMRRSTS